MTAFILLALPKLCFDESRDLDYDLPFLSDLRSIPFIGSLGCLVVGSIKLDSSILMLAFEFETHM